MLKKMLMLGVCFIMLFSGVVYAQEVGVKSVIISDFGDQFTLGYLVDDRGVDMAAIMGPSIVDVTNRVWVRPFARASMDTLFGGILNVGSSPEVSNYGAGLLVDWNVVRYQDLYLDLYVGEDYEIDEDANGNNDFETVFGASITFPLDLGF